MVRKATTTSAGDREAQGERFGEVGYPRARWHTLVHMALVALPFVLGVLVPVLLLALLHWLS